MKPSIIKKIFVSIFVLMSNFLIAGDRLNHNPAVIVSNDKQRCEALKSKLTEKGWSISGACNDKGCLCAQFSYNNVTKNSCADLASVYNSSYGPQGQLQSETSQFVWNTYINQGLTSCPEAGSAAASAPKQ